MEKKIKILIIEDETLIAMYLKMKLIRRGYEVCDTAAGKKQALDLFEKESPDIILSDIMLTNGETGIDIVLSFREAEPDLPVIFLTGYEDDYIKEDAMKLDPLGFFIKPVDIDEVALKIDEYFFKYN